MTAASTLAEAAAAWIDLRSMPFAFPGSRLLVRGQPDGSLQVIEAAYEVGPDEAIAVRRLTLFDERGDRLAVSAIRVDRIELGPASITFAGTTGLSITGAAVVEVLTADGAEARHDLGAGRALLIELNQGQVVTRAHDSGGHAQALSDTARVWADWFSRCPLVGNDHQPVVAHCWWVLAANTVELASAPGRRVVVPSKLGYLGLWQWDAYFIAIGLRHGDLDLAREQLDLALAHAGPDGQLPDVLHDRGVLASSSDLPLSDQTRMREMASPAADPTRPIPLTKPPLAALALSRLSEAGLADPDLARMLSIVSASQQLWLNQPSLDGLPVYAHPYCSGLDDSPVFDHDLPVASPDLAAYLVLQDRLLADLFDRLEQPGEAGEHRQRAERTRGQLLRLWDAADSRFRSRSGVGPVATHAVVDLLPLLVGDLPDELTGSIRAALADPARFATPFPVPTVAVGDPTFAPDRMWRGPVWLNMNWLLVEGLRMSGHEAAALELAAASVAMVGVGRGAFEYYNPHTGRPPASAVPMFSWTAALVVDLAVSLAATGSSPTQSLTPHPW